MIRGLILYYLNIKPTHGYEIQRYIQLSGMDQWAKIQSGSIYYALAKLEKEKNSEVLREERTGSRVRKIYQITEQGKKTLHREMQEALSTPLFNVGSLKFFTTPMLSTLPKDEIKAILTKHIEELTKQKDYWELWKDTKAGMQELKLMELSFTITIASIDNQILWHQELLNNLDSYMKESKSIEQLIRAFDADSFEGNMNISQTEQNIEFVNKIKEAVIHDPKMAIENLDKIILQLKKEL